MPNRQQLRHLSAEGEWRLSRSFTLPVVVAMGDCTAKWWFSRRYLEKDKASVTLPVTY
jgi:hypothetical protein